MTEGHQIEVVLHRRRTAFSRLEVRGLSKQIIHGVLIHQVPALGVPPTGAYGTTLGCRFSSAALCEYLPRYWWHEQVEEFSAGDTAMMVMYASYVSPVADRSLSKVIGKVGFGNIPGNCPVLGGWALGINRNSKKFDTALAFLQWACDKKQAIPLTLLGSLSACQEVYRSNEIRSIYPWVQKSLEIYPTSHRRCLPPSGEKIGIKQYEEIIARAVCDCVTGNDEPESALQKAAQKFNQLLG